MPRPVDLVVIGAGSAGLAAIQEIRRTPRSWLLVDPGPLGTTCARVGCMPSKMLLQAADDVERARRLVARRLLKGAAPEVDGAALLASVRAQRDPYVAKIERDVEALGASFWRGAARFTGPNALEVEGHGEVTFGRAIVAVGSAPIVPEAWRALGAAVSTSDDVFAWTELPRSLAVIGLGAVGLELAQALARLGVEVLGFGRDERIGGLTDPVVDAAATRALRAELTIKLGAEVALAREGAHVLVRDGNSTHRVEHVLVAAGRKPRVGELDLANAGVKLADGVPTDIDTTTRRVGDTSIFVAGDAAAERPVLHEAVWEGRAAARGALGLASDAEARRPVPLAIVFCQPNLALVGARFDQLPRGAAIGAADFTDQGRAKIMGEAHGALRIYAAPEDGRLLGAEIAAPGGEHLAHLLAWAVASGATAEDALRFPFYHPTVEEGLRTALRALKA